MFAEAAALYWFAAHYHEGQWSPLYSILSARLDYRPGTFEVGPPDEESQEIYAALIAGEIDAEDLLTQIQEQESTADV